MNTTHLHLLLNHIPVLGSAFAFALLLFGFWRRSDELKKTALGVFIIVALLAVPAYLTGEPVEHVVTPLPGVSKPIIEQHEQAAAVAFAGVLAVGVVALAGLVLFRRGKALPTWFASMMLGVSLIASGLMAWTANLGGQVRHTEIRSSASLSTIPKTDHD